MNSHIFAAAILAGILTLEGAARGAEIDDAIALPRKFEDKVLRAEFTVQWLPDGKTLWYRAPRSATATEFVRIDAETGERRVANSLEELGLPPEHPVKTSGLTIDPKPTKRTGPECALQLTNQLDHEVQLHWLNRDGKRESYGSLAAGAERVMRSFDGHRWLITDSVGDVATFEAKPVETKILIDGRGQKPAPPKATTTGRSPDGRWTAFVEQGVMMVRDEKSGRVAAVRTGQEEKAPYRGTPVWAPDSSAFVIHACAPVPKRRITFLESAPAGQVQPKVESIDYVKPGDPLPKPQPLLFRVGENGGTWRALAADLFPEPFTLADRFDIRWAADSSEFYFDYNQRGHQLYRVLGADARTAAVRVVVEEKSRTFIDYTQKTWRHWLPETGELLWMSERDGWCHLWLYDVKNGAVKSQVTRGAWPVRDVLHVDETRRQVWFLASGLKAGEDPYQQHLCRVKLDGSGFVQLTAGDGDHAVKFSPDRRFFTDTWSRPDQPPVHELRRSEDGRLICELERADATALFAAGWTQPERFVAKGRDGKTDIHGVIIRPSHFDPGKKYPVLEEVYAGPHGAFAPKRFETLPRQHSYAELGFIVVKADGMGTNHRGKAFHDVAWQNLQDAGFPDRIAWIRAAAATRPWMDLSRVGIFGGSAGGQNAMRALLDHGAFYQAAFADCGCHDNRMDKIWWNEQWLGWPVGDAYVRASNVADATKLRGKLALCVGEIDRNVDPASTMQVVAALQKAGKPFEFFVIAGTGHGAAETPWANRRRMEFFARELLTQASSAAAAAVPARVTRNVAGWSVLIHRDLLDRDAAITEHALELLARQLTEITRVVPRAAVAELQRVPLYFSPTYPGRRTGAEFHPDARWLVENGRDPAMAGAVEFSNIPNFEAETNRMPNFALHELAHAYHFHALAGSYGNQPIKAAYERARKSGSYERVERWHGNGRANTFERAYAMSTPQEYFAECTETYFSRNDFFPFTRDELKKHDPEMFTLVETLWGVGGSQTTQP